MFTRHGRTDFFDHVGSTFDDRIISEGEVSSQVESEFERTTDVLLCHSGSHGSIDANTSIRNERAGKHSIHIKMGTDAQRRKVVGFVDHTHRRSTLYVDVLGVLVNLSGRHSRSKRTLRMRSRFLEAHDEAVAFVWTACEMTDRRAPGAVYKYWAQGQDLWHGRDQFDVCAYDLAEISSTSAPAAWPRSVRRVRLQLVGDRPAVSISIDPAEQLTAPLLIVFQICINFDPEIDPCPALSSRNCAALSGIFNA